MAAKKRASRKAAKRKPTAKKRAVAKKRSPGKLAKRKPVAKKRTAATRPAKVRKPVRHRLKALEIPQTLTVIVGDSIEWYNGAGDLRYVYFYKTTPFAGGKHILELPSKATSIEGYKATIEGRHKYQVWSHRPRLGDPPHPPGQKGDPVIDVTGGRPGGGR